MIKRKQITGRHVPTLSRGNEVLRINLFNFLILLLPLVLKKLDRRLIYVQLMILISVNLLSLDKVFFAHFNANFSTSLSILVHVYCSPNSVQEEKDHGFCEFMC
ncbi:hypothetical protein P8452_22166 [Trifolium repens]|nr:hypothetical protein P8452_22166 [Trifolium repens]